MTKHYKQHLAPHYQTAYGQLMRNDSNNVWYLKVAAGVHASDGDEIIPLPLFLGRTLYGAAHVTRTFGPYIFWNDFDKTQEARYLMNMFSYRKLTPVVQQKVKDILEHYKPWIDWDKEFIKALEEREHDLDITQPWQCSAQMIAEADCSGDILSCQGACYGN